MSDAQNAIPYMFRGESRIYSVVGVQGETIYGLNVEISGKENKVSLILALACLNDPPEGSPFKSRHGGSFLVAFNEKPTGKLPIHPGHRLNKIMVVLGENLSSFELSAYLETQLPVLQKWLDETLEAAAIVPTFNNSSDIFNQFFGNTATADAKYYPLALKPLGEYAAKETQIDYSKYGQNPTPPSESDDEEGA
jgi:hypothetical protein